MLVRRFSSALLAGGLTALLAVTGLVSSARATQYQVTDLQANFYAADPNTDEVLGSFVDLPSLLSAVGATLNPPLDGSALKLVYDDNNADFEYVDANDGTSYGTFFSLDPNQTFSITGTYGINTALNGTITFPGDDTSGGTIAGLQHAVYDANGNILKLKWNAQFQISSATQGTSTTPGEVIVGTLKVRYVFLPPNPAARVQKKGAVKR